MWSVYVLKSLKSGKLYTGMSENPDDRLKSHNAGKVKSTKSGIPWVFWYVENGLQSADEARKRELYLKSAAGKRFINVNISNM